MKKSILRMVVSRTNGKRSIRIVEIHRESKSAWLSSVLLSILVCWLRLACQNTCSLLLTKS